MKKIAIVGASGHGKVVADIAELNGFEVVFFDNDHAKKIIEKWEVVGNVDTLLRKKNVYINAIVAIGDNKIRTTISNKLLESGFILPILIHPSAVVSKYSKIKSGSIIFANAVLNAFSYIGVNCIINTGAIVEHDCVLGDGVHLSPNVSLGGGTEVSDKAWLGIGSVTKQMVKIGENSTVGANSLVISDIPDNTTVYGSPAKIRDKGR